MKLYLDYAAILTENEEQRGSLLQVVKDIENKLATLKNRLWLLIFNSQPQHLQAILPIKSNTSLLKVPVV